METKVIKENKILLLDDNNNGLEIDVPNKNVFILFWNKISKKFSKIPSDMNYFNVIKEHDVRTKEEEIEVNKVIYTQPYHHNHIIKLFEKYDKKNYEPYDNNNLRNRALSGLIRIEEEGQDDYIPEECFEPYDQLSYQGRNCWRPQ